VVWARLGPNSRASFAIVQGAAMGPPAGSSDGCQGNAAFGRREPWAGGRTWWAHFALPRINIELTILYKKMEEFLKSHRHVCPYWAKRVLARTGLSPEVADNLRKSQRDSSVVGAVS
jgi:hypothetical protein